MNYKDENVKKAIEVLQSFWAINKTTTKFTQQNAESLGITLQQLSIINTLYSFPGLTLKNITERLFSSKSTVSVSVDGLVSLGLVERTTSDEDRREINLKLTSKGEELSRKSSENAFSYKAMILALEKMDEKDVELLLKLNKELLCSLQEIQL
ncbi:MULTISPECIES: MarR family winged helix-turn-helix transcriptional regulator [unclassified Paenibacillus]|uniref:MarR family winged helix-turn-helix transcriptional regulator n=1 Tax=unclassified Paenibacillus TaxID=185978 RepID=UPI003633E29B